MGRAYSDDTISGCEYSEKGISQRAYERFCSYFLIIFRLYSMRLHVVSFQVPFPPDYGGVIDVYHKLKALKEAGCSIVLHTFFYAGRGEREELREVADEVYYYKRFTGIASLVSTLPYIVYSRRNPLLLERLCEDDSPILFEGIHTCYFLSHPLLRHRLKWVRMHNVEHVYYCFLSRSTSSLFKKIYYRIESLKLKRYEKILQHATRILAITEHDRDCLARRFSKVPVEFLPCFYDMKQTIKDFSFSHEEGGMEKYLLWHGNLSVSENIKVVNYIFDSLLPLLDKHMRIIIAGKNPPASLLRKAVHFTNVLIKPNPAADEMERLIVGAQVNVLLTFQRTGVKLKLIHTLSKGRGHCLVNSLMLPDEMFRKCCTVADTPEEQAEAISHLFHLPQTPQTLQCRQALLAERGYDNRVTSLLR